MALLLVPTVLRPSQLLDFWWQYLLLAIICITFILGGSYIFGSFLHCVVKRRRARIQPDLVSKSTKQQLVDILDKLSPRNVIQRQRSKPNSFTIYLGDLSLSSSDTELELLTRSDLTIVDPLKANVVEVIARIPEQSFYGRISVAEFLKSTDNIDDVVTSLVQLASNELRNAPFAGAVLADWQDVFSPAYLAEVLEFFKAVGLSVLLETSPPSFLPNSLTSMAIPCEGFVLRNASILPNGERRDYFDMQSMQATLRQGVRESCLRDFYILAWETVDDNAKASNAVIKRAIQWASFYSVVPWIGQQSSLYNIELNHPLQEPLGAFEWLKDDVVMKFHAAWKGKRTISSHHSQGGDSAWKVLLGAFPEMTDYLASNRNDSEPVELPAITDLASQQHTTSGSIADALSSISGYDNRSNRSDLGCCSVVCEPTALAFAEVVHAQMRLRDLGLLHPVDEQTVTNLGVVYRKFYSKHLAENDEATSSVAKALKSFSTFSSTRSVSIYLGLSPGFSHSSGVRFWGVWHRSSSGVDLFLSRDAQGLASSVLHTFLLSEGVPYEATISAELAFCAWSADLEQHSGLSRRIADDIDSATPEELLMLLQKHSFSSFGDGAMAPITNYAKKVLLEVPVRQRLGKLDSFDFMNDSITPKDLIQERCRWYDENNVSHPSPESALNVFTIVNDKMLSLLRSRRDKDISEINNALHTLLQTTSIDAWVDLFCLAIFCSTRKAAIEEVYLEVTDRNPLFNDQSDQAAVFSESFALGSRCEAYFDISPSEFGQILSRKFRSKYFGKQPPLWNNGAPDYASTYSGAQIDVDIHHKPKAMPQTQRFTFLSVFALPALVDIALLSTIGRGLYLSAFMKFEHQQSATLALMISLVLSGATGTWIAHGGTYYLGSMAFSAMNMFVLTRLIAGMALAFTGGVIGFVAIAAVKGFPAALLFFLYLIGFTAYLNLFAAISCYQFPGTAFLSGRKQIFLCLPILILSPIVTMWSGHDLFVYLPTMFVLVAALMLTLGRIASRWATWFINLKKTTDAEIRKWYTMTKAKGEAAVLDALSDPAALKVSREALLQDVRIELAKGTFSKPTSDTLVKELAADFESTTFLLDWYCRYADVPRPIPFSSSWNIQTKVAQTTLIELQKGSRLHGAFVHWRQAGEEVACGLLYFFVALLDKWVDLLCGYRLVGLSASLNDEYRIAVGLGLAYYLIGTVLIDIKAVELHGSGDPGEIKGIGDPQELRVHQKRQIRQRRSQYYRVLFKFLAWNCWGLALTASLLWVLNYNIQGLIMFLVYVFAYTGLIWFQYTKIFSGPDALKPLMTGFMVGLPVGVTLRLVMPEFRYGSVIALVLATWTAAISCMWAAHLAIPRPAAKLKESSTVYHAYIQPWRDQKLSNAELEVICEGLERKPREEVHNVLSSTVPGSGVKTLLLSRLQDISEDHAFPDHNEMIEISLRAWETGQIEMILIPSSRLPSNMLAIGCKSKHATKLYIGVQGHEVNPTDLQNQPLLIAEILLQEVARSYFEISAQYAWLSSYLVNNHVPLTIRRMVAKEPDRTAIIGWAKRETLRQECLGIDCDVQWDNLPSEVRKYLVARLTGSSDDPHSPQYLDVAHHLSFPTVDLFEVHLARCNLYIETISEILDLTRQQDWPSCPQEFKATDLSTKVILSGRRTIWRPFRWLFKRILGTCKYSVVAILADAEYQREFQNAIAHSNRLIRIPLSYFCSYIWIYSRFIQEIGLICFASAGRPHIQKLWNSMQGTKVSYLSRGRIVVQNSEGICTAFRRPDSIGGFMLYHYKGNHRTEPQISPFLITTYSADGELASKEEVHNGDKTNRFEYDYKSLPRRSRFRRLERRIPTFRRCVKGPRDLETVCYNSKGLIVSGSYITESNLVNFRLGYRKRARFAADILRADFSMSYLRCKVEWCAPPSKRPEQLDRWIPFSKVTSAVFTQGPDTYESTWTYDHKLHPKITTKLNGEVVPTPPLIEHDWLGFFRKPIYETFANEDIMSHTNAWNTSAVARLFGGSSHVVPISTSVARSMLWKDWKNSKEMDGVLTRWLDERLLRSDDVLAPYWRARNRGDLKSARAFLKANLDAVRASSDLDAQISGWTPLAIKIGDLQVFGPGGESIYQTTKEEVEDDTHGVLQVFAADYGTWPNEGGGVSACRRDLVNSLETIRWHMVCESATDFGTPKHQTEHNVQSLKVIPLWGLDFLTPTHGIFQNRLHSEVDMVQSAASDREIREYFIPALTALVKGARAKTLSVADLQQATRALVSMNEYFSEKRHWGEVWRHEITKDVWRSLWLSNDLPNVCKSTDWLDTELPTLAGFDSALEMWLRYLFIFSIKVPDKMPAVYQASHHSVSATYGIVCKLKRGCQLQIWDHAIAWRETTICLSSTLCKLPPFVRNSLMGLMRLTSVMVMHHADVILPCADFFNPGWEVEIGSGSGTIEHRNKFKRKVSPVVNGIADAEKFKPVKEIKTQKPTVTMLSHLWFAKDLKTAILAADIIVNEWGFTDYQLDVYGSIEKAPIYSTECQELIASKTLRDAVKLCGTPDPLHVLEQTWLFLNSSLSEGLPLALGEAALTGAPVVCTDVGASLRVLSDPEDFSRYSAVVAPNDARALARAQIKMLGMLDEFGRHAGEKDAPTMPFAPTPTDVEWITQRMYEKSDQRRKLGMMTRKIVQKSFGGDRYLREHEQMLWIGKYRSLMDSRAHLPASNDPSYILHWLSLATALNKEQKDIPRSELSRTPSLLSLAGSTTYSRSGSSLAETELEDLVGGRSSSRSTRRSVSPFELNEKEYSLPALAKPKSQLPLTALPQIANSLPRRSRKPDSGRMTPLRSHASQASIDSTSSSIKRGRGRQNTPYGDSLDNPMTQRFRSSDVSVVDIDVGNDSMSVQTRERDSSPSLDLWAALPPASHRDTAYRNLSPRRSSSRIRGETRSSSPLSSPVIRPRLSSRKSSFELAPPSSSWQSRHGEGGYAPSSLSPWSAGNNLPSPQVGVDAKAKKAYFT